jgi:hypothetical protein
MKNFVAAIRDGGTPRSTAQESLESHLLAFASEDARISRNVIDMAQYRAQLRATVEGLKQ